MTIRIVESEMTFGPYDEADVFHIEKSALYLQPAVKEKNKMAEFILRKRSQVNNPRILFLEAKSSAPNPVTRGDFDKYLQEIKEKLLNALHLTMACVVGRHAADQARLPTGFLTMDRGCVNLQFVLVIRRHKDEWLPGICDALIDALRPTCRLWAFDPTPVLVLNEGMARAHRLIE